SLSAVCLSCEFFSEPGYCYLEGDLGVVRLRVLPACGGALEGIACTPECSANGEAFGRRHLRNTAEIQVASFRGSIYLAHCPSSMPQGPFASRWNRLSSHSPRMGSILVV